MVREYVVDVARRTVRVRVSGVLTAAALRSMFDDIRDDARITPDFCTLIDLRDIRFVPDLTGETVRVVASRPLAVARQAFVASDPLVFGVCRMFATYRALAAREPVAACRSIDEAEQWLGLSVDQSGA